MHTGLQLGDILAGSTVYDGAHKRLQKLDSFDKNLNSQNANLIP